MTLFTIREAWTMIHGILFGGGFLLAFTGGLTLLYNLKADLLTAAGARRHIGWLKLATLALALLAWLAVLSGTYLSYPWYRASPPEGVTFLRPYPRSYLKADPDLAFWHTFGMEWKEHIAWFSPLLSTAVAFVVWRYGEHVARDSRLHQALIALFILAFAAAAIAGLLGALITKAAPVL
jgi:hypothetical protein